jgi:hypothetical protein
VYSVWRVPNVLLEPRGSFLGERVELIDTLNRLRTLVGTVMLIGVIIYYSGLSHLTTTSTDAHGVRQRTVTANSPEGHWLVAVIVSAVLTAFLVPLVAAGLVLWTRSGYRRAALYQMRWPALAIAGFFALFAVIGPAIDGADLLSRLAKRHHNIPAEVGTYLFSLAIAIISLVWLVKALWFAASGMFRADDGHPFLALIAAPAVAILTGVLMLSQGSDGLSAVPRVVGWVTGLAGPVSITALSIGSVFILRHDYPGHFPFRTGPLTATPAAEPDQRATAAPV